MKIIAADIGGTNSRLAAVERSANGKLVHHFQRNYESGDFADINELIDHFLVDSGMEVKETQHLCLALAGPVDDDVVSLTNIDWKVDKLVIRERYGFQHVSLINDFQAAALGTASVADSAVVHLNVAPSQQSGRRVVLGAGTGLGVAYVHDQNGRQTAYATEGGHIDFAPVNEEQQRLRQFLADLYGDHVSYERLLSGQGLADIYRFVADVGVDEEPQLDARWVNEQATAYKNPLAKDALNLFVAVYGAFAGNMALLFKPEGGIDIAGGIAGKMVSVMQSDCFHNAYLNKGRMQKIAAQTAVRLITDESSGLRGAIEFALDEKNMGTES